MELLAPAKDLDNLKAAFDAGASAVYLGLKNFSARKRAKNFSFEELYTGLKFARSINKKIFVAINTLIYEKEIKELFETLFFLEEVGVDGIIIQDYGVYKIVKDFGISLPLIASTQMATTNSFKAKFLEDLGFKRIILERQLTLKEIEKIRNFVNIELEVFIHGAMCFSLSGLCHFSGQITGKSGNRGECVQPCRWMLEKDSRDKNFYFSMKDLCGISYLKKLKELGIDSIKIEGRLKGIDYTYPVVSAYREILDCLEKNSLYNIKLNQIRERLKNIIQSRELSEGFFKGLFKSDKLIDKNPSAGLYIGKISGVFEKSVYFNTQTELSVGDQIRIVDKYGKERYKIPVKVIYKNKLAVKHAYPKDYIGIPYSGARISNGDKIFLVGRRGTYKFKTLKPISLPENIGYKDKTEIAIKKYESIIFNAQKKTKETILKFDPEKKSYVINGREFYFIPAHIFNENDYRYFSGIKNLLISHPAEAKLLRGPKIYGSFNLYCTNKMAALFFKSLGIEGVSWLPDSGEKGKFLNIFPEIMRWKNIPLFITRVGIKEGDYFLKDRNLKVAVYSPYGFKKL